MVLRRLIQFLLYRHGGDLVNKLADSQLIRSAARTTAYFILRSRRQLDDKQLASRFNRFKQILQEEWKDQSKKMK